jgi:hypothetical protein
MADDIVAVADRLLDDGTKGTTHADKLFWENATRCFKQNLQ